MAVGSGLRCRFNAVWRAMACLALLLLSLQPYAYAQRNDAAAIVGNRPMQEVIVTGVQPGSLADMARSISVITADDIAMAAATDLTELLAQQSNIVVNSFSTGAKFSRLDIRGSGDTSVSNVLTLIDGVKVNTPDLAGTDFSIIALEQIDRIEIVRGANSVRYGSGASQGVINIITQPLEEGRRFAVRQKLGSFGQRGSTATGSVANNNLRFSTIGSLNKIDGYRDNSALDTQYFQFNTDVTLSDRAQFFLKHRVYQDHYQLPGPLSLAALNQGLVDRRASNVPSQGNTDDRSYYSRFNYQDDNSFKLDLTANYRQRENGFAFAGDFDPDYLTLRHLQLNGALTAWTPSQRLQYGAGFDFEKANYRRASGRSEIAGLETIRGEFITRAAYLFAQYKILDNLSLSVGYRHDATHNRFLKDRLDRDLASSLCETALLPGVGIIAIPQTCPFGRTQLDREDDRWYSDAVESGLILNISERLNSYISVARTFRNPNVDELALGPDTRSLQPQSASRVEIGFRYRGERLDLLLNYFLSSTRREIVFRPTDSIAGRNINFDKTIDRSGLELELTGYISDALSLTWNLGYVDAQTPDGLEIPLVPKYNTSLAMRYRPTERLGLSWVALHVDERLDGNDFNNNQFERLDAYTVVNMRMAVSSPDQQWELALGINNALDKDYIPTGYSGAVYPAPGRSLYGEIRYEIN